MTVASRSLWALVALVALVGAALAAPLGASAVGAPYQALTQSLDCRGNVSLSVVVPVAGTVVVLAAGAPARYGVDLAQQAYAFDIAAGGVQYVFANGTYEYIFEPALQSFACYYFPQYTFAFEKIAKSTAVKKVVRNQPASKETHAGLCLDAGAGFSPIYFSTVTDVNSGLPDSIDFQQRLPKPAALGAEACAADPTQLAGSVAFSSCSAAAPADGFIQLPSLCWGLDVPLWLANKCF